MMNAHTLSPFQQEGYDLMAAVFEVYNEMGSGFLEEGWGLSGES